MRVLKGRELSRDMEGGAGYKIPGNCLPLTFYP